MKDVTTLLSGPIGKMMEPVLKDARVGLIKAIAGKPPIEYLRNMQTRWRCSPDQALSLWNEFWEAMIVAYPREAKLAGLISEDLDG